MNYYLINTLGRANKFFTNNQFGETIIKENKNKVRPSANTILDKILRKTAMLSIISLTKTREVIARESVVTNNGNYYLAVNNIIDVSKLV